MLLKAEVLPMFSFCKLLSSIQEKKKEKEKATKHFPLDVPSRDVEVNQAFKHTFLLKLIGEKLWDVDMCVTRNSRWRQQQE